MKNAISIHSQSLEGAMLSRTAGWRASLVAAIAMSILFGGPVIAADDECSSRHNTCQESCQVTKKDGTVEIDLICAQACTNEYLACITRNHTKDLSYQEPATYMEVQPWSTVGSAAAIDESSLGNFYTRREVLGIRGSVSSATVVARWALSDERFRGKMCPRLRVRYNDNGQDATVYVRMIRSGVNGGSSTRADFLSDNAAQTGWQTQEVDFEEDFDFSKNAYFLETWISKSGSSGVAEVGIVQIDPLYCID